MKAVTMEKEKSKIKTKNIDCIRKNSKASLTRLLFYLGL
jgi:hypothetical protein